MCVEKSLTSLCLVSSLVKPLRKFTISQTFLVQVLDDIAKFRLVVGVCCKNEISSSQNHLETEEHINVSAVKFITPVGDYSTVTLFARLRGWSTSVPFTTAV